MARLSATAVFDVGKTAAKLVCFNENSEVLWQAAMANVVMAGPPYPHVDSAALQGFLETGLREAAAVCDIATIVVTTHGAAGALVDEHGLVLPIMDYEWSGPLDMRDDYESQRPPYAQSFSPSLPQGLNLGRQLFWQRHLFPQAFASARHFLTFPQYWGWWLTGVAASEITSLGCHTDLWEPLAARPSGLAIGLGLAAKIPPLRRAWETLGTLRSGIADATGLAHDVEVKVGIHDSNASLLPHLAQQQRPFCLLSTGTWVIALHVGGDLARLDPQADMLANVAADGHAIACARFMGGREYETLLAGETAPPNLADVAALVASGTMALPAFSPMGGPYAALEGRIVGPLAPASRPALATLYCALMCDDMLTRLDVRGDIIVDGNFSTNPTFPAVLAQLRPANRVFAAQAIGTAAGAAALATWPLLVAGTPPVPSAPSAIAELEGYRRSWRQALLQAC